MKSIGEEIKTLTGELNIVETNLNDQLASLPNIPADGVQPGGPEENITAEIFGTKPGIWFYPKGPRWISN